MPEGYPEVLAALLRERPVAELGPGSPREAYRQRIAEAAGYLPPACQSGLWLAFDFLDESHTISQDLSTPEGSYWHAIMHRREPDPGNSKYWYRLVGSHPILPALATRAKALGYAYTTPFAFIDFCERVRGTGTADEDLAKSVQHLEWELLFQHSFAMMPT